MLSEEITVTVSKYELELILEALLMYANDLALFRNHSESFKRKHSALLKIREKLGRKAGLW